MSNEEQSPEIAIDKSITTTTTTVTTITINTMSKTAADEENMLTASLFDENLDEAFAMVGATLPDQVEVGSVPVETCCTQTIQYVRTRAESETEDDVENASDSETWRQRKRQKISQER